MTGKTSQRASAPGNIPLVRVPKKGLQGSQHIMAKMFEDAGYNKAPIGKDIENKAFDNGSKLAKFSLATNEYYKNYKG